MTSISFVVIVYNDYIKFCDTISSLISECCEYDEVVIVDSSSDDSVRQECDKLPSNYSYTWVKPAGIYSAQNFGIGRSIGDFVCVINSGDLLLPRVLEAIRDRLAHKAGCYIFSQIAVSELYEYKFQYHPRRRGEILPHQSIFLSKDYYRIFGPYSACFEYFSEQFYFFDISSAINFEFEPIAATQYDLDGLSSRPSFDLVIEYVIFNVYIGKPFFYVLYYSIVSPLLKSLLMRLFGPKATALIKSFFARKYSKL